MVDLHRLGRRVAREHRCIELHLVYIGEQDVRSRVVLGDLPTYAACLRVKRGHREREVICARRAEHRVDVCHAAGEPDVVVEHEEVLGLVEDVAVVHIQDLPEVPDLGSLVPGHPAAVALVLQETLRAVAIIRHEYIVLHSRSDPVVHKVIVVSGASENKVSRARGAQVGERPRYEIVLFHNWRTRRITIYHPPAQCYPDSTANEDENALPWDGDSRYRPILLLLTGGRHANRGLFCLICVCARVFL
mmetsp:Transcript_22731/g.42686  ORF Transcript_22731/g.42686 Transcript_22731/m.42686 type:complete len:247 (+) Transcript_22731:798-1538(+)